MTTLPRSDLSVTVPPLTGFMEKEGIGLPFSASGPARVRAAKAIVASVINVFFTSKVYALEGVIRGRLRAIIRPVKRLAATKWTAPFAVVLVSCLWLFFQRISSPELLQDSDTRVLLDAVARRNAPLSWFGGDWPLANHFYRPLPTLAFELDRHLYGNNAAGYGMTNMLLCILCTLLLFWYLRELTDRPWLTGIATTLFALWQIDWTWPATLAMWIGVIAFLLGMVRHGIRGIRLWLPPLLVGLELSTQIGSSPAIGHITFGWLPGRTATVMTVFALIATAAYARYERLSAERSRPEITPLDPPATRSSVQAGEIAPRWVVGWALLAVAAGALAFASYEQAVMLPAIFLATACTLRWQGYRVRWGWQGAFWGLLVGYAILRHALIPSAPSSYQLQQFRDGSGVWLSIAGYLMPSLTYLPSISTWTLDLFPAMLLSGETYQPVLAIAADIGSFMAARRRWLFIFAGWGMAFLAYLPMAWLKQFDHYHYWPMALKSLFVTALGWLFIDLVATAWSPRTEQAPPRRDPAPGSLPHR